MQKYLEQTYAKSILKERNGKREMMPGMSHPVYDGDADDDDHNGLRLCDYSTCNTVAV